MQPRTHSFHIKQNPDMFPASHIRTATVQVLATSTLTEVKDIFSEETMTISDAVRLPATCTRNNPTVSSVRTMVPEKHPSMTTTLKHLKSHKMPPCTNMPSGVASAPSVQAIVVNCVSIVKPQLASIIRDNLEVVWPALKTLKRPVQRTAK